MPFYDYECQDCGVFTAFRPMSESAAPSECPDCAATSPRAFVKAPALASMDAGRRKGFATNERASHEPKLSSAHGAGCACCSRGGLAQKPKSRGPAGAKSFPAARPWMISH